jgi:glycosyltransferase involved in cell wall biosynthesis
MTDPRALLVAPTTPALTGNGLAMRLGVFRDALSRIATLDTLVLPIAGPMPEDGTTLTVPVAGRADTRFALLSRLADPAERLRQFRLYGRGSRHSHLSAPVLAEIRALRAHQHYDLAHICRLYLADAVDSVAARRLTLDLDEDDAWAWRRLAATQPEPDAAWSEAEAEAEDRLLARRAPAFDDLFVASDTDRQSLVARYPTLPLDVIPNAIAFPAAPQRRDDGCTLLFVGAFGYRPNIEGILWFVHEVWPRVQATAPATRLRLVGRDPPAVIRALHGHANAELLGPIDDLASAYAEATLAIAPLHTGAGTRLKLIEAAAYAVPIVSTTIAARGLDFVTPETAWLADDPAGFAAAVLAALADPDQRTRRAALSRTRARKTHDREQVVERLALRFARVLED